MYVLCISQYETMHLDKTRCVCAVLTVTSDGCLGGLILTFVCVNLLYPGEGVDFHQGVRNADHVHPIHDTLPRETQKYVHGVS